MGFSETDYGPIPGCTCLHPCGSEHLEDEDEEDLVPA